MFKHVQILTISTCFTEIFFLTLLRSQELSKWPRFPHITPLGFLFTHSTRERWPPYSTLQSTSYAYHRHQRTNNVPSFLQISYLCSTRPDSQACQMLRWWSMHEFQAPMVGLLVHLHYYSLPAKLWLLPVEWVAYLDSERTVCCPLWVFPPSWSCYSYCLYNIQIGKSFPLLPDQNHLPDWTREIYDPQMNKYPNVSVL